ncbi:FecR family protein [Phyllobacterium sp. K27]
MMRDMPNAELDTAAHWVSRMDADNWSAEDEAELQTWLDGDPTRRGELARIQAIWFALEPLQDEPVHGHEVEKPIFRRRTFLAAMGGAIAASVVGGLYVFQARSYETELGEIRRVALTDGSVATINTVSRITVQMRKSVRHIRVDRGEAWFQVAKGPNRPFVVEAGDLNVRAVGTAFSVRRLDHGAEVMVTEGAVETWSGDTADQRVYLDAGNRAFISEDGTIHRQVAMAASIDRSLAWRTGKIILLGDSLGSAIAEFNRYNRRKLVLLNPRLGNEQLDGVFRIDDLDGFARTVGEILAVPIDTRDNDTVRIG